MMEVWSDVRAEFDSKSALLQPPYHLAHMRHESVCNKILNLSIHLHFVNRCFIMLRNTSFPSCPMRPFLLGILKCKKCVFTKKLALECRKVESCAREQNLEPIFNKHLFLENNGELLRSISSSLNCFQVTQLSNEAISSFVENPEDDILVRKFLFCIDIVDGSLICSGCQAVYQIENSILDMV